MADLASKKCLSCDSQTGVISPEMSRELLKQLPDWQSDGKKLHRTFVFPHFPAALKFLNAVGAIAETEGHHPDLFLHQWNKLTVSLWTHVIGGLSENDFIMAAKIDRQTRVG